MLETSDRTVLLDTLRPPVGYELDFAVGTTYSLDLVALLAASLGFTMAEWRGNPRSDWASMDSLALLKTLRQHAGRIVVFCDSAHTYVPVRLTPLFTLLEGSVIPARSPAEGGAFHPKTWTLRFKPLEKSAPVRYRMVVMTRNLTFDRSLDAVALLEGDLIDRQKGFSANRPLAGFLNALPALATIPLAKSTTDRVRRLADESRRVQFVPQAPFGSDYEFHYLGLEGGSAKSKIFDDPKRRLVISPFVSERTLRDFLEDGGVQTLISRPNELAQISTETIGLFDKVLVPKREMLELDQAEEGVERDASAVSDLHAKIYFEDLGARSTRLLIGSANATVAAFARNVEFLVALTGPTSAIGPGALLDGTGRAGDFANLWEPYAPGPVSPVDTALIELEERVRHGQAMLGGCRWKATITQLQGERGFECRLMATAGFDASHLEDVSCRVWPVLLRNTHAVPLSPDGEALVTPVSFEALTAFWAMELRVEDSRVAPCCFVVRAHLVGEPADRQETVTRYLILDSAALVQFLTLLLALDEEDIIVGTPPGDTTATNGLAGVSPTNTLIALLEPMLQALHRRPSRLDSINQLLVDLKATPEGRTKLTPEIEAVWSAIWEARGRRPA